jgi:predicted metal-dependent HD superfamily phosphohydrolase
MLPPTPAVYRWAGCFTIFTTPFFVERYEAQARANLERALETL